MRSRAIRLLPLAALALLTSTIALAQSGPTASSLPDHPHYDNPKFTTWNSLAEVNPGGKLLVVTLSQPTSRHTCSVHSMTATELVCKAPFGATRTYPSSNIAALIVPGDFDLKMRLVIAFNAALGASIWGTVVLAAACPPCAVATGIAAFLFFGSAGAVLIGDDVADTLLYLAPGQTFQAKLRY